MDKLIQDIKDGCDAILADIDKNTKAAEGRVRKATIALDKTNKMYRKQSVAQHKN